MTALVLLFLVTPGESDAPVTLAMRQAAIQVLGSATAVVIREAPEGLSDDGAIQQGDALHAIVVVRLSWLSQGYLRAQLRLHLAATSGWISREVGFEPQDAPPERGRALGYSVAAVVAGDAASRDRSFGSTPPRYRTASFLATPGQRPADGDATGAGDADALDATALPDGRSPRGRFFFLDAVGATSTGSGGTGGQARLGWSMASRFSVMLGGGGRVGTLSNAHASASHLYLTLGAGFQLISFWRIAFAGRGEAVLVRQSLSHFSDDDAVPVRLGRWLPGFRPQMEMSIRPSRLAALIVSGGWELTAGATDVYVRGAKVATIPASRLVAEVGLRVQF